MSHTDDVNARQTTNHTSSLMQEHPRGRGFSILSRLARGEAPPSAPVQHEAQQEAQPELPQEVQEPVAQAEPEDDQDEWRAPVLPFDRPTSTPAPRHRRDVEADSARRTS